MTESTVSELASINPKDAKSIKQPVASQNEAKPALWKRALKMVVRVVLSVKLMYLIVIVAMLLNPSLISTMLFAHWLRLPGITSPLSLQDLRGFRMDSYARNIIVPTSDNIELHGWHILPPGPISIIASQLDKGCMEREVFFDLTLGRIRVNETNATNPPSSSSSNPSSEQNKAASPPTFKELVRSYMDWSSDLLYKFSDTFDFSLETIDTDVFFGNNPINVILFFHGNALDRGWPNRVELVKFLSSRMNAHVIVLDPRGFGGNDGTPTEEGVHEDAKSAYMWLSARKATSLTDAKLNKNMNFFLYGHSMGSAILTRLAKDLCEVNKCPKGLILDSPFTSTREAVLTHPGAAPFRLIPALQGILMDRMQDRFPTVERVAHLKCPLLIVHGDNDEKISVEQGRQVFEAAKKAGVDVRMHELPGAMHSDAYADAKYLYIVHSFMHYCINKK